MISYSETPKRQNRLSAVIALCCAIAGLVLLTFSRYLPYTSLIQMISLIAWIVAIYMTARAVMGYTYRLQRDEGDGQDELAVIQTKGKKTVTVCRLLLRDLREIDLVTSANEKSLKEKYRADRIHNYCPDLCPARSVYLLFEENGQRIALRLQAGEEFLSYLKRHTQG
jgi:hypothetical protein